MISRLSKVALVLACLAPALPAAGVAQEAAELAGGLSPRILFVTSGGYWEKAEEGAQQRGYYRLIAIRGEDNRSLIELQHIALTPDGPELLTSAGIEEINSLGAYVTDIRPEDSTGTATQQGFGAYIYLKTAPNVVEPETWVLYIDDVGDIQVERSSN
ncbi:MAG: hypothetical protein H6887_00075 [Hoeflea sp.]|nr:hypothetical protein [Hoeflea sp.]